MVEIYKDLNDKLEKMESIMHITNKNLYFDKEIIDCDPDYAVIKARKIAEGICKYLVVENRLIKDDHSIRNATLEVYLQKFLRERKDLFPKDIIIQIETIQKYGNLGGHYQEGDPVTQEGVEICLKSLSCLLNWFNREYVKLRPEVVTPPISEYIDKEKNDHWRRSKTKREEEAEIDTSMDIDDSEISLIIRRLSRKFSYNIYERIDTKETYEHFYALANVMFHNTVEIYTHGKLVEGVDDIIYYIITQLTSGKKIIQVKGLPGTGKNMLLQLAFYRMLDDFSAGKSKYLPLFISVNYYEKMIYDVTADIKEQIKETISHDISKYIFYIKENKDIKPVLFVDAVREHQISEIIVENILNELIQPMGKASRIISIDSGLIKNKTRVKKVITLASGDDGSCSLFVHPISIRNKTQVMEYIDCVIKMYQYEISAGEIYEAAKNLQYSELDIFLIRLLTKEMFHNLQFDHTPLSEIYEKMALAEFAGNEQKLLDASKKIFEYTFTSLYRLSNRENSGMMWSLAHKHQSFLEFLLAFYFINRIREYKHTEDYSFFEVMLTSMANRFVASFLQNDYSLQETVVEFVNEKYSVFNVHQKSNAAYWMGRITYKNLSNMVLTFLTSEFSKLKLLVKTNNKNVQENLDNHFLFRAICTGLITQGQANMMDEYLCIVITNDIANAINRGTAIEYFSNNYQLAAHNTYYLDTDLCIGEKALLELNERIEAALYLRNGKFVESNLITMLMILQARIQNKSKKLKFNIIPYVNKALEYLNAYRTKPQNVASAKIIMYFESIKEDLEYYLKSDRFDIAPLVYNKYRGLKDVKRQQWVEHDIYDPESVSEHSFSAWLMAALFLPEEYNVEGYIKREILDMILIHDMADAELGDASVHWNETSKNLKEQNYIMKKLFLKGTYPDIANLTYYYNVWTGYYTGININAKVARDVNLIQTVYTFLEYYCRYEGKMSDDDLKKCMAEKNNLITDIGYELFERLITDNSDFAKILKNSEGPND